MFVQGKNLTDDEQRYHASFIKDFAPQPGRTIEAGIRMRF
jgi:iron complex outermembrane receptor protein